MLATQAESPATVTQSAFPEVLITSAPASSMSWISGSEGVAVVVDGAAMVVGVAVVVVAAVAIVVGGSVVVVGVAMVEATVLSPSSSPQAAVVNRSPTATAPDHFGRRFEAGGLPVGVCAREVPCRLACGVSVIMVHGPSSR